MKVLIRLLSIFMIIYLISFMFITSINNVNLLIVIGFIVGVELLFMLLYFTVVSCVKLDIKTRKVILLGKGNLYYIYLIVLFMYLNNIEFSVFDELIKYSIISSLILVLITSSIMYLVGERIIKINILN